MFEFAKTFLYYPSAATFHALQGLIVGFLGARAVFKKEISDSIIALLVTIAFMYYEATEQWKIDDSAYLDFEFMWVTAMFTGLIYAVIHLWRSR